MIHKCKPERNSRQAKLIILASAAAALATIALQYILPSYKIIPQIAFFVVLAVAIQVAYRYTMTEMEYSVGVGAFSIDRKVGRKIITVAVFDLSASIALIPKDEYDSRAAAKEFGYIAGYYNYKQNLKTGTYVYVYELNTKTIAIEFEPNQAFILIMNDEISNSKKDKGDPPSGEGIAVSAADNS